MTATGNAVANAYWAGRRGAAARLPAGSPGLAAHLERKVRDHETLTQPAYASISRGARVIAWCVPAGLVAQNSCSPYMPCVVH